MEAACLSLLLPASTNYAYISACSTGIVLSVFGFHFKFPSPTFDTMIAYSDTEYIPPPFWRMNGQNQRGTTAMPDNVTPIAGSHSTIPLYFHYGYIALYLILKFKWRTYLPFAGSLFQISAYEEVTDCFENNYRVLYIRND